VRAVIPPTLFFFVGFNLILFTKRLFLADYLIAYTGFLVATTSALIVGKVVLVANELPLMRFFQGEPLAYPILFKTVMYTVLVFIARLLEEFIRYLIGGGRVGGGAFAEHVLGTFSWPHFIAVQLWIFVLFLIYVTATELNELFGDGELFRIMFRHRVSVAKATRRARIRLLARLSRLTEANSPEGLADPGTPAHAELMSLLRSLTEKR
jgi:hypothetical protein